MLGGSGFVGFDPDSGEVRQAHELQHGGWGARYLDSRCFFIEQTCSGPYEPGAPSRIELGSGEIQRYCSTENVRHENGWDDGPVVFAEEGEVGFYIAPDLVWFDIVSGDERRRWNVPGSVALAGLTRVGDQAFGVTHVAGTIPRGALRYLEYNPTPLVFLGDDGIEGVPILANGKLCYGANSAVQLSDGEVILAAEVILYRRHRRIVAQQELPDRQVWGNATGGLIHRGRNLVVFQSGRDDEHHCLKTYRVTADPLRIEAIGEPMRVHREVGGYMSPCVDFADELVIVRGDRRFHVLKWAEAGP